MDINESRNNIEYMKAMMSFYPSIEKGWITTEDGQHLFIGGDGSISGGKAAYEAHQNESKGGSSDSNNSEGPKKDEPEPKSDSVETNTSSEKPKSDSAFSNQAKSLEEKYNAAVEAAGIGNPSAAYDQVKLAAMTKNIEHIEVKPLDKELSTDEIIEKVGGGDTTSGSCASLALAYAANKVGLDVTDFRGGDSAEFFSKRDNLNNLINLNRIIAATKYTDNDFDAAAAFIDTMDKGKEYIMGVGAHAAVVRCTEDGAVEYLELQTENENGFRPLTGWTLFSRFSCTEGETCKRDFLIDIDSLKNNKEFKDIMGHLNTQTDKQQKGAGGGMK